MRKLLFIIFILGGLYALYLTLLGLFNRPGDWEDQSIQAFYVQASQEIAQRERNAERERSLQLLVDREATRLGIPSRDLSRRAVVRLVVLAFGRDYPTALAIGMAEHGLQCDQVVSPTQDYGPMQINIVHKAKFGGRSMLDCQANVQVAKQIFDASGWNPWVTYQRGAYLRYL